MFFTTRDLLQVLLGLCVGLAAWVLLRDLIPRGRKLHAKLRPRVPKEASSAPNLSALESELE
jgi:hypothetical protein